MSDTNQNAQNIRYPAMYKLSVFLREVAFYLVVAGFVAMIVSKIGLIDESYIEFYLFVSLIGAHLLCSIKTIMPIAINPMEYFRPIEEREKKKRIKDEAIGESSFLLVVVLFVFAQSDRGSIYVYLCVLTMAILVDIFCFAIHVFYGNGIRKIKLY